MLPLSTSRRLAACFALVALTALVGACVAQEPYREPPETGGKGSGGDAGKGGLDLATAGVEAGGGGAVADVECVTSAQCSQPYPYCLPATGRCVQCLSGSNCSGTGVLRCDLRSHACVACLDDTHCGHQRPYCAHSSGQCVECLSTENCGDRGLICDRRSFQCVPSCTSHQDCVATPQTPFCDPETSLCVGCLSEADCAAPTPHCSPTSRSCVQCLDNADCQPGVACVAGACLDPK